MIKNFLVALVETLEKSGIKDLKIIQNGESAQLVKPDNTVIATVPTNLNITQTTERKPYKNVRAYLKRSATTEQVKPSAPTQIINVKGFDVLSISLTFDANFKTKGFFEILVNSSPFLEVNATDLTDVTEYRLDLDRNGWQIPDFASLELRIWTSDGTSSAVTLSLVLAS